MIKLQDLLIGRGELDFSVDAAGPEKSRVEDVYAVSGHDDLQETIKCQELLHY